MLNPFLIYLFLLKFLLKFLQINPFCAKRDFKVLMTKN